MGPFCDQISKKIAELGQFRGNDWDRLRELAAKFEFGELFDVPKLNEQITRVADEIGRHCERCRFSRRRLLAQHQPGFYVGLLSIIAAHPNLHPNPPPAPKKEAPPKATATKPAKPTTTKPTKLKSTSSTNAAPAQ